MAIRCKFVLNEIRQHAHYLSRTFVFQAQYDQTIPEDQRFAKASPTGRFEIQVDNPAVFDQWKLGEAYYFDATPVKAT